MDTLKVFNHDIRVNISPQNHCFDKRCYIDGKNKRKRELQDDDVSVPLSAADMSPHRKYRMYWKRIYRTL
uniref:Uncharacterized protein n=1 Tax=Octopus bimaculoides TaxID=37653 RepID=A0A0L8FN95_OCTBM